MAEQIQGKITQIIGAVLDIKFPEGKLPKIYDAIHIAAPDGGVLTAEVAQHLGDDTVRSIAMRTTKGMVRRAEAKEQNNRNRCTDHRSGRRKDTWTYLQCNRRCD